MAVNKQSIERNQQKIDQLESLIQKLGDENSVLRLQLEERKAHLDYVNTLSKIEGEKRRQAETTIFGSEVYQKMKELLRQGNNMGDHDWQQLEQLVNSVYTNFTERLYSLYNLTSQDYHVSLLIKVRIQPKDIVLLTAHSKESVASTRSRLYQKVFGSKGSSKDWDDFILTL
jgi:regulator of replication initiation timing